MIGILDVFLATIAIVLGLSLIVQAIQQIIKQIFDLKSGYMRFELLALFNDGGEPKRFSSNFIPISLLGRLADGFSRRIVGELEERMTSFGFTDLHVLENINADKLKDIVLNLPVAADLALEDKVKSALTDIEKWFEISKQAFREHYERRMKFWSLLISAVVVLGTNANLIDVYNEFSTNKPLRDAAIAMGQQLSSIPKDSLIINFKENGKDSTFVLQQPDSMKIADIKARTESLRVLLNDESFGVIGWSDDKWNSFTNAPLRNIAGWGSMILLVSLGAPFWYDLLKTITNVKQSFTKSDRPSIS